MRLGLIALAAASASVIALTPAVSATTHVRATKTIVELPVSFDVVNTNTSGVPCPSDLQPYTVRGHLVGPESIIYGQAQRAITVYLHGHSGSEINWALKAVPGYDLPVEMTKMGHVSLNLNLPGYAPSDFPPGIMSCVGSDADIVHQIIGQLREPGALLPDGTRATFARVALAGHDAGATIAEVEAYSYKDIDGLFLSGYADTGFQGPVTQWSLEAGAYCLSGQPPEHGVEDYYRFPPMTDEEFANDDELLHLIFSNTDEAVIDWIKQENLAGRRQVNPCGIILSVPLAVAADVTRLREVTVPVLIFVTDGDFAFSEEGYRRQVSFFGSDDVSAPFVDDAPHFWMWGLTADEGRRIASDWLCSRGLVSAGVNCSTPAKRSSPRSRRAS